MPVLEVLGIVFCSGAAIYAVLKVNSRFARMTDGTRR